MRYILLLSYTSLQRIFAHWVSNFKRNVWTTFKFTLLLRDKVAVFPCQMRPSNVMINVWTTFKVTLHLCDRYTSHLRYRYTLHLSDVITLHLRDRVTLHQRDIVTSKSVIFCPWQIRPKSYAPATYLCPLESMWIIRYCHWKCCYDAFISKKGIN